MTLSLETGLRSSVRRTPAVVAATFRRRDAAAVAVLAGVAYLVTYLVAIGDLSLRSGVGTGFLVVADPLSRMVEPGPGRFAYEAIAVVDLGVARYLLSPINTAIGAVIAVLVGLNLGLSYVAVAQPQSCGLGASSGLLASVPALLAGGACCAPVALLALGITASGTVLLVVSWLLPIGILALCASLLYLAGRIDSRLVPEDPSDR